MRSGYEEPQLPLSPMHYEVKILPAAQDDLEGAALWAEREKSGLGSEFLQSIGRVLESLEANPLLSPKRHRRKDIRWCFASRFPYRVVYQVQDQSVTIVAILHVR